MATATYTVADAKTDPVAITFKWRTLLPTDVAAATLADLGGALQSGTGSIAANASPRQAQFSVTTTPNTTVEGDRSFDVEIYDVTPSGATLTVSKVRTKIVEDDATTGPTIVYGPTVTKDTLVVSTTSVFHKVETLMSSTVDRLFTIRVAMNDNGDYIEMRQDGGKDVNFRTYIANAQQGGITNFSGVAAKPADGAAVSLEVLKNASNVFFARGKYGDYTYDYFGTATNSLGTGTKAQGLLNYTVDNSGRSYTISKS